MAIDTGNANGLICNRVRTEIKERPLIFTDTLYFTVRTLLCDDGMGKNPDLNLYPYGAKRASLCANPSDWEGMLPCCLMNAIQGIDRYLQTETCCSNIAPWSSSLYKDGILSHDIIETRSQIRNRFAGDHSLAGLSINDQCFRKLQKRNELLSHADRESVNKFYTFKAHSSRLAEKTKASANEHRIDWSKYGSLIFELLLEAIIGFVRSSDRVMRIPQ